MDEGRARRSASVDTGDLYEGLRRRFVSLVTGLSDDALARPVPATPAWSVRDVFAHVGGLAADINALRIPGADDEGGAEAWTNRQVERGRGRTVAELAVEWEVEGPRFAEGLRMFGYEFGCHFVADLHAHVQDVHGALGLARLDDDDLVAVALDHYLGFVDGLLVQAGWGSLVVTAGSETHRLGGDAPHAAAVAGAPFELLRMFAARRSLDQIRALAWTGDVDQFLGFLSDGLGGSYAIPARDLAD